MTTNHEDHITTNDDGYTATPGELEESAVDCCCTPPATRDSDLTALEELRAEEITPEVAALRSAGFHLLLKQGRPVDREEWASASRVDIGTLDEVLESAQAKGRVQFNADGQLVGIAGLTVEPGRHRLDIDGAIRWTWCALDALGILGALEASGTVYSMDPWTGDAIEIGFTDGIPADHATMFILGGYDGGNAVDGWCPMVNFFTTRGDAEAWVLDEGLEGDIVALADVAVDAAAMWRPVLDPLASEA